jgi:hypothetical protein
MRIFGPTTGSFMTSKARGRARGEPCAVGCSLIDQESWSPA